MNLRAQLEGNSFAELIMRNTNAHSLKADPFATADCKFELSHLDGTAAGYAAFGQTVADDPTTRVQRDRAADPACRTADPVPHDQQRRPAGINGQSVYNGTAGVDRICGGNDNDTFLGNEGADVIDGGDGDDVALGGDGNDIITDFAGADVPKGGPGNDAIDGGLGIDIVMGGDGNDFTNGGANDNETFGGDGDDFVIAGQGADAVFGDSGDDWVEGGTGPTCCRATAARCSSTTTTCPGNDVLIGQPGDDDYDTEGGDDIGVAGPGIENNAGAAGWDWAINLDDPQPADADLNIPTRRASDRRRRDPRPVQRGRSPLRLARSTTCSAATSVIPSQMGGGGFIGCDALDQSGLDRIPGLDALVPPLTVRLRRTVDHPRTSTAASPASSGVRATSSSVVAGSDLIEGRGADDVIDGDRYLRSRISVRTDGEPGHEIGTTDLMEHAAKPGTSVPARPA